MSRMKDLSIARGVERDSPDDHEMGLWLLTLARDNIHSKAQSDEDWRLLQSIDYFLGGFADDLRRLDGDGQTKGSD